MKGGAVPDGGIYLFKAARRPLYRQQNLHLLAAERGTVMELAWNRAWVASAFFDEGSIARGAPVVLVLTDRPYALFVPVRSGEVVEARHDDVSLRLRVALGSWIQPEAGDLAAWTAELRAAQQGDLPGDKFVAPRRDKARLIAGFDAHEDAAWTNAVDGALALSAASDDAPYADCVFFRPAGLRVGGDVHQARREPLAPGDEADLLLRFHNPHLPDERLGRLKLHAIADRNALRAGGPLAVLREGDAVLPLRVVGTRPDVTLQVSPNPAAHTSLTLRLAVRQAAGAAPAETVSHPALLDVFDAFCRHAALAPEQELPVLEAFERALPADRRVAERLGVTVARAGQEPRAFEILSALEPEWLDDDARFLLFGMLLRRGRHVRAVDLLAAPYDLAGADRTRRLLDALDATKAPVLDRAVRELVQRLADPDPVRAVLDAAASRLTSPEMIADVARDFYLGTGDAASALSLLRERARTLRLSHPAIADGLLELAEADAASADEGDLADAVEHRVKNLLGRGDAEQALSLFRRALPRLRRDDVDRIAHGLADRLVERDRRGEAAHVLVELSYRLCDTGDLEFAADAVERACGVLVADETTPVPDWLRQATARVESALHDSEALAALRGSARESTSLLLHELLRGAHILLVGGLRREHFVQPLRDVTGAEAIEFHEDFRTEGDPLAKTEAAIRAGRYRLVVFRVRLASHTSGEMAKRACTAARVPFAFATGGGLRGITDAIRRWAEASARQ